MEGKLGSLCCMSCCSNSVVVMSIIYAGSVDLDRGMGWGLVWLSEVAQCWLRCCNCNSMLAYCSQASMTFSMRVGSINLKFIKLDTWITGYHWKCGD